MTDGPGFAHPFRWEDSADPNDETFGDVVTRGSVGDVDGEAVLVGEPYDGAVIGRRGARKGPAALRAALARTKTHHFDAGPVDAPVDLGDVDIRGRRDGDYDRSVGRVQESVRAAAGEVHRTGGFPVFLGGDNSLSYANVAPLLEGEAGGGPGDDPTTGVVNFDAHLDCRALHDGPSSGTPYRQLLEAGLDELAVVGARHFETSTAYHDYFREQGGEVVTAEECTDPVEAVDRALESLGDVDVLYASVDLDVVAAAAAPGVSAPTPGGVPPRELFVMLRVLAADDRLAGFEVVECAPRFDAGDRTSRVGARAVAHVLAARGVDGASGGTQAVEDSGSEAQ
ncbi:formimidoylglutamase [Halobacteriales archaeon QS_8_69_26]|nr:MAG: formimidoylglutamase [Halobacteriales archaeon QS_8_69_26]